jgi:hypothetical protein
VVAKEGREGGRRGQTTLHVTHPSFLPLPPSLPPSSLPAARARSAPPENQGEVIYIKDTSMGSLARSLFEGAASLWPRPVLHVLWLLACAVDKGEGVGGG